MDRIGSEVFWSQIGNGVVIDAETIVTHDVRSHAIVAGNFAKKVKRRFANAQVAVIPRIAWWTWPLDRITDTIALLNGPTIDELLASASAKDGELR